MAKRNSVENAKLRLVYIQQEESRVREDSQARVEWGQKQIRRAVEAAQQGQGRGR